jgi:hypothetical protein
MKPGAKCWLCLAGSVALFAAVAQAATPPAFTPGEHQPAAMDNPYNPIVERNIFDLHDPPPPPEPKSTNAPPPNIHLTGITTILGKKQAYFLLQSAPVPGKPAQGDTYMTLGEGQRKDMLEVLSIDPKSKMVKISNSGNISTITFETNKLAFAAPHPAGGPAGNPGGLAPAQPGGPAPNYYPNSPAGVPPRPLRPTTATGATPYGGGQNSYGGGGQYGGYQANANGAAYGNQAYNGYNQNAYNQGALNNGGGAPQAPALDPEQQIVLMELQREATKQQVAAGQLPPLPPTVLSQAIDAEHNQQNQGSGPPPPVQPIFPGQHNTIK